LHADIQARAKTIHHTRQQIGQSQAACLFSVSNFLPKTINTLIEGFNIRTAEIASLASHIKTNPHLYLGLLRHTAQQIKQCLQ